ncbi:MAG: hypothetical protein AAF629_31615 [Chloroflexota bacterium]
MIRSDHRLYDIRRRLNSAPFILVMVTIAGFFILVINFQYIYLAAFIFILIITVRNLIGRRCPQCDGPLKEMGAETDRSDAFIIEVTWQCPKDGYSEIEKTKGNSGLFGVS